MSGPPAPPPPAQIANDLDAQARRLGGTGQDHLVLSLRRGARTIRALLEQLSDREAR